MQKILKTLFINAPREKVWNTMLDHSSYSEWTKAFNPSSSFTGSWEEGSSIKFLGVNPETGEQGGMSSKIVANRLHEFVSIEHMAEIRNGAEGLEEVKNSEWAGAHENYTFEDKDGGTLLTIELDVTEKEKAMMGDMWDTALVRLKGLAES